MTTIISGVNGFIGGDLFQFFTDNNNTIKAIGIGRSVDTTKANFFNVDLIDTASVQNFIANIKQQNLAINAFVHTASILADANNQKDFKLFTDNNTITQHVIKIIEALQIKTLVNLSTIGVYPNVDGEYVEASTINTAQNFECLYGLSKFCSEQLFNFYLLPQKVNVINLRLSQVYGKRMRADRIYKIMEAEMLAENKITVWGNGERVSNFVPIEYVLNTINHFICSPINDTFNVGGQNLTYKQLAQKVIDDNDYQNVEIILVDKGVKSKVFINSDKLEKVIDQ